VHVGLVFVNHTHSPEAKYPVALEEAMLQQNGLNKMATALSLLAKERGGHKITFEMLFYPVTDANFDTPSYMAYQEDIG
jgi:acetyl esterase